MFLTDVMDITTAKPVANPIEYICNIGDTLEPEILKTGDTRLKMPYRIMKRFTSVSSKVSITVTQSKEYTIYYYQASGPA